MCRGRHTSGEVGYIDSSTGFLQRTEATQFLTHGQKVDGLIFAGKLTDRFIDQTVLIFIEDLGSEQVGYGAVRIFLNHERTEHRVFQLLCLRGQFAHLVRAHFDDGGLRGSFVIFVCYCHMQSVSYVQR